jgi:hypothetical protein
MPIPRCEATKHPLLDLAAPVEFLDKRARIAPTRFRSHVKLETRLRAEHALDLQAAAMPLTIYP